MAWWDHEDLKDKSMGHYDEQREAWNNLQRAKHGNAGGPGKVSIAATASRQTFEVPQGFEAVCDAEGRATGEVKRKSETGDSINDWVLATFGAAGTNESVVARANQEMAELITAATDREVAKMLEEAADVVITLNRLFHRNGTTMQAEVDKKMAVNRRRKWTVRNGHGQHVEGT